MTETGIEKTPFLIVEQLESLLTDIEKKIAWHEDSLDNYRALQRKYPNQDFKSEIAQAKYGKHVLVEMFCIIEGIIKPVAMIKAKK